ncbi:conserved hypothetical protein [Hyphomicrobiales bacterium]|jgi:hypothetical protein|nr:conserved hypothetical protein [Hyphomicrobiales bacterium]CAH1702481.1 hypothetical protein BOSEA1005_30353 [Hyphomicrobiales bacterium]CAI0346682.1 conserved hypothetical protein [Hyphomicrobiales bacterium]
MHMTTDLTRSERKLLEWCARTLVLESQVAASGLSRALNELLLKKAVRMVDHPTVREGKSRLVPAAAVEATDAGKGLL